MFAIAFAVSICLGTNPSKFIYDQTKMRPHVNECLEDQKFCNFQFRVNTNWNKKKVIKKKIYTAFVVVDSMTVKWCSVTSAKHGYTTAVWMHCSK